jgi:hypothetical protein
LALLDKAAQLSPVEPLVQFHLGQYHAAAGDRNLARLALQRATQVSGFPRRAEALAALRAL